MMNRIYLLPLMIKLTETEKRVLIILAVVLAFIFVIIGLIVRTIRLWMIKEGKKVDFYLYDLCKHRILEKPSDVIAYVFKRESRSLYLSIRWAMRVFVLALIGFIIYFEVAKNGAYSIAFNIIKDLIPRLEWPRGEFFGMNMINGWPTVVKKVQGHLDIDGYITYVMLVISIWCIGTLMIHTLGFIAKQRRARKVCNSAFGRSLEGPEIKDE